MKKRTTKSASPDLPTQDDSTTSTSFAQQTISIMPASAAAAGLSRAQCDSLRCVLALMIPADAQFAVPGADDPVIFADLLASIAITPGLPVQKSLARLDALSGGSFAALEPAAAQQVAQRFLDHAATELHGFYALVLQCYYRDDRVMRSLNIEPRPPFPKGFTVEQGDWSLLDAVRARPKVYREVS